MLCIAMLQLALLAGKKDTFFEELKTILSSVPAGEKYIVLGEFNARVGSSEVAGDQ